MSQTGGALVWAITNWYAASKNGPAAYMPLIEVGTGTVLTCTGMTESSDFNYTSKFTGYPSCDLVVTDVPKLTNAFETFECYGSDPTLPLTQCSDYPDTDYTAMYNIEIRTGLVTEAGTAAVIEWSAVTNFRDCGQPCLIASNDSPGGDSTCITVQPAGSNWTTIRPA